ncbi:P1 family peptidase [Tepidicaulis sp. LMO-SS28]|uniref:P1 family peptidase n=1 Tax=Tepidicaulis sp. LMO-SS28 TaxID=3447455 RepID=UPI003EDF7F5E
MTRSVVQPGPRNLITDIDGIAVGQVHDARVKTGVSAVLPEWRMVAGVDVAGGGPGTRETEALDPDRLVDEVDAIVLSGGSSYGLDAAGGVAGWLGARGRGFRLGASPVVSPIVPGAILFDLANGGDKAWGEMPPYHALGREACEAASKDVTLGKAGAGFGARAGQLEGGMGSVSAVTENGLQVGALMAVNAFGSAVIPGTDFFWAAPYELAGEFGGRGWPSSLPPVSSFDPLAGSKADTGAGGNTTIGVIATNARLTQAECRRMAKMAQDGMARALRPVHAPVDGDTLFVLSSGKYELGEEARALALSALGGLAADCVARAIARGVYEAGKAA